MAVFVFTWNDEMREKLIVRQSTVTTFAVPSYFGYMAQTPFWVTPKRFCVWPFPFFFQCAALGMWSARDLGRNGGSRPATAGFVSSPLGELPTAAAVLSSPTSAASASTVRPCRFGLETARVAACVP